RLAASCSGGSTGSPRRPTPTGGRSSSPRRRPSARSWSGGSRPSLPDGLDRALRRAELRRSPLRLLLVAREELLEALVVPEVPAFEHRERGRLAAPERVVALHDERRLLALGRAGMQRLQPADEPGADRVDLRLGRLQLLRVLATRDLLDLPARVPAQCVERLDVRAARVAVPAAPGGEERERAQRRPPPQPASQARPAARTTSSRGAISWRFPIARPAQPSRLNGRRKAENGSRTSSSSQSSGGRSIPITGETYRSTSGSSRRHSSTARYASSTSSGSTFRASSSLIRQFSV